MVVASSRALVQSFFSFSFFFRNINRVGVGQEIFAQQNISHGYLDQGKHIGRKNSISLGVSKITILKAIEFAPLL